MTILTKKMGWKRAGCKVFWPCVETAGSTITDVVEGLVITGTTAYAVANAINIYTSANQAVSGLDAINLPKAGMMIALQKVGTTPSAFATLSIGRSDGGNTGATVTGAGTTIARDSKTAGASLSGDVSIGDTHIVASVWDGSTIYGYEGINADAALVESNSMLPALSSLLPVALNASVTLNSSFATTKSSLYAMALFDFENGIPSDILTAINVMKTDWLAGRKEIYEGWMA